MKTRHKRVVKMILFMVISGTTMIRTRGTDLVAVIATEIGKESTGIEVEKTGTYELLLVVKRFFFHFVLLLSLGCRFRVFFFGVVVSL